MYMGIIHGENWPKMTVLCIFCQFSLWLFLMTKILNFAYFIGLFSIVIPHELFVSHHRWKEFQAKLEICR